PALVAATQWTNECIAESMAGFQNGNALVVSVSNVDLRHKLRIRLALENRFDTVGLGAYAVDRDDFGSIRERVDIITNVGVGWRKNDATLPFHGQELLFQMKSDGSVGIIDPGTDNVGRERGHARGSSCAKVTTLFLPESSRSKRNCLSGIVVRPPASA